MDNIESYIWLFCLEHPGTNITQVSDFLEWYFVAGNSIFQFFFTDIPLVVVWKRSFDNRNHKLQLIGAETVSPIFCQIWRISWQRSYCDATRALDDVTAMSRGIWRAPSDPTARLLRCYSDLFPRRSHCAYFEHVQNFHNDSAAIWPILQIAARSPSCVTGVLPNWHLLILGSNELELQGLYSVKFYIR